MEVKNTNYSSPNVLFPDIQLNAHTNVSLCLHKYSSYPKNYSPISDVVFLRMTCN